MSDAEIRELERLVAADPTDDIVLERLAATLTRCGRGWKGEPLPPGLVCANKDYLYGKFEMVYVKGFYIGKYPVTFGEWHDVTATGDIYQTPIVNISRVEILDFCTKHGLRLPSPDEWKTALIGLNWQLPRRHLATTGLRPARYANREPCKNCFNYRDCIRRASLHPLVTGYSPARPCLVSDYGCYEMIGHVWQLTGDGTTAYGWCYNSQDISPTIPAYVGYDGHSTLGFRVALGGK